MSSGLFKPGRGKQSKNKQPQPPMDPYFPPHNHIPPVPQQPSKTHQRWTTRMTQIMISALLEEVARDGKKAENAIKKDSMTAAATAVNKALGMNIDRENVRSKYKTLKKDYSAVKALLDASRFGFEWDKEKNMVVNGDSDAFARFLQAHPNTRKAQGKSFPYYDEKSLLLYLGMMKRKTKKLKLLSWMVDKPRGQHIQQHIMVTRVEVVVDLVRLSFLLGQMSNYRLSVKNLVFLKIQTMPKGLWMLSNV